MIRVRSLQISGSLLVILLAGAPARAELYKDLARGLSLLDFRFSGEQNVLGDGKIINANAFYNNRQFDFGFAELTLNGQVNLSAGYTRRGIPGADFTMNTGNAPLSYNFRFNNGIQDVTAVGDVLVNIDTDINALGFYDTTFQVSNRGTFTTDGFLGEDGGTLAFDVGPINTSGNVFADLLAAVTQPFFDATGTENPFAKFGDKATKLITATKTVEDLQAKAAAGEVLTDQELATLINNSIVAAVLGGKPSGDLFNKLMVPDGLLNAKNGAATGGLVTVPEPSVLTTLGLTLAAGLNWRRRARR